MTKVDQTIHNFAIYKIKKATIKPYDFKWTRFYENPRDFLQYYPEIQLDVEIDELIICSTVIDTCNYSFLTTRRLITRENGVDTIGLMAGAKSDDYTMYFKVEKYNYVIGTVTLKDDSTCRYFIETGRASMIMIYGIMTFIGGKNIPVLKS